MLPVLSSAPVFRTAFLKHPLAARAVELTPRKRTVGVKRAELAPRRRTIGAKRAEIGALRPKFPVSTPLAGPPYRFGFPPPSHRTDPRLNLRADRSRDNPAC